MAFDLGLRLFDSRRSSTASTQTECHRRRRLRPATTSFRFQNDGLPARKSSGKVITKVLEEVVQTGRLSRGLFEKRTARQSREYPFFYEKG